MSENTGSSMNLQQICSELELSSVWVRRQLSKRIGALGENASKDEEGLWSVPTAVVEQERKRLEEKRQKYDMRKRGELPKYYNVYTPLRVKAPQVVKSMLEGYVEDAETRDALSKLLDRMTEVEEVRWTERKKKKKKAKSRKRPARKSK